MEVTYKGTTKTLSCDITVVFNGNEVDRVILLLEHLKFWNTDTANIGIPDRSLLQVRQTSTSFFNFNSNLG